MKRGQDPLIVQVSLTLKLPGNRTVKVSRRALQSILDRMIEGGPLPKNVIVRGIFWRNPARRGSLGAWRWHVGAGLKDSDTPSPLEAHPRESSWQACIPSLAPFIEIGGVKF